MIMNGLENLSMGELLEMHKRLKEAYNNYALGECTDGCVTCHYRHGCYVLRKLVVDISKIIASKGGENIALSDHKY